MLSFISKILGRRRQAEPSKKKPIALLRLQGEVARQMVEQEQRENRQRQNQYKP